MSASDYSRRAGEAPLQRAAWVDGESSSAPEARVGGARLVKGGAKVTTSIEDATEAGDAAPSGRGRVLGEAEIAESGLLQERVFEFGEMREEAVVSKQAVVREELVVRRDVEERTEEVAETLRRTEVEIERIEAGTPLGATPRGDPSGR